MKNLLLPLVFLFIVGIYSCGDDPAPSGTAPQTLVYSPNSYSVSLGTVGNSVAPTATGDAPFTYSLVTPPGDAVSINASTGVISSSVALPVGVYNLAVKVTNSAGSKTFTNVFTITVTAPANMPPSGLSYSASALTVRKHENKNSVTPTVAGTPPFTFTINNMASLPAGISINASNGVITIAKNVDHGTYNINVTVTNAFGSVAVKDALVVSEIPVVFSGAAGISSLVSNRCKTCHTVGPQTIFTVYATAKSKVDLIISRTEAGEMPQGGPSLPAEEIALIKQWKADGLKEN